MNRISQEILMAFPLFKQVSGFSINSFRELHDPVVQLSTVVARADSGAVLQNFPRGFLQANNLFAKARAGFHYHELMAKHAPAELERELINAIQQASRSVEPSKAFFQRRSALQIGLCLVAATALLGLGVYLYQQVSK